MVRPVLLRLSWQRVSFSSRFQSSSNSRILKTKSKMKTKIKPLTWHGDCTKLHSRQQTTHGNKGSCLKVTACAMESPAMDSLCTVSPVGTQRCLKKRQSYLALRRNNLRKSVNRIGYGLSCSQEPWVWNRYNRLRRITKTEAEWSLAPLTIHGVWWKVCLVRSTLSHRSYIQTIWR